jgi:NADH-quinone oxidoreductase subunit M
VSVCVVGLLHSTASSIMHLDLKKLIAYSSIVHMQFSLIGVFANDSFGLNVAVLGLLVHGIVSIGLFYTIGQVSESVGTRHVAFVHCGIALTPMLSLVGFITVLLNISTPLSLGALVEVLTLTIYGNFGTSILVLSAVCAV